jgi:subtilase family serine protease
VNGTLKLVAPLVVALAIAACNGGSSNVPGATGAPGTTGLSGTTGQSIFSLSHKVPDWLAKGQAKAACPQVVGTPTCLALTVNGVSHTTPSGWGPTDLQTRYNLPSSTNGSGQIVAIVDAYDNPNITSDLAAYRTQFGLGTAEFTKYNQEGQTSNYPSGSTGWGTEEDLDVDMVSAGCPKCTIYLIEANSNNTSDLETAEAEAVTLGAHIISNSWICYASSCGTSESSFDTPGVLYLAASGDAGYNQNGPPEWFSSVVSVGGTQLHKSGSTYSETVWNGAGGGCSSNGGSSGQTKPSWQHDPSCTYRTDSDVSSEAGCSPGVAEYDTYGSSGWIQICGTSAASPLNAAVFGLAGNASTQTVAKKFWSSKQRKRKKDLNDISVGNDGSCGGSYLCTAGTNQFKTYSGPAGWGSPKGIGLY